MKPKLSTTIACIGVAGLVFFAIGWWRANRTVRNQRDELAAVRHELERAQTDIAAAKAAAARAGGADVAGPTIAEQVRAIEGDQPFEDALGAWIAKVKRLEGFLRRHPELGIPELAQVTANDWLDATKAEELETEADFRQALARLRQEARKRSAPAIREALTAAMAANGGNPPARIGDLAPYLPDGFDASILQRFRRAASDEPGLPRMIGASGPSPILIVEDPVDPIWDYVGFYAGANAGSGIRAAAAFRYESVVAKAIEDFTAIAGNAPSDPRQLAPFLGDQPLDAATVADVFQALTTPVAP